MSSSIFVITLLFLRTSCLFTFIMAGESMQATSKQECMMPDIQYN